MTQLEVDAVVAFLKTLTGSNVYVDKKWSDPFIR
jgi:cytochrome c peroxidase